MSSEKVQVYYWPFLGRGAAALLMLTEAGVDFEHVSYASLCCGVTAKCRLNFSASPLMF